MKPHSILKSLLVKFAVVIAICLSFNNQSKASHAMGADFTYRCLGGNQYELTLTFYRDCSGIGAPLSVPVTLNSVSCGQTFNYTLDQESFTEISATCPGVLSTCQGGTEPGVEEYIYIDTVTITTQCTDWLFSFSECCRNPTIMNLVNPSGEDLYIESALNNTGTTCNSSPVFSSLGVPYLCNGILTNFNFGAFDVDGDSLVFSMINPLSTGGTPIAYQAPYSLIDPITTVDSVSFDSVNGLMSFTPSGLQVCIVTVLVQEYRDGIFIGSVMRDIQILITNCGANVPPAMSSGGITNVANGILVDTTKVDICVGDNLTFDVIFSDANAGDVLTLTTNIATDFPMATFIPSGTNPMTGSFSWTPGLGDAGLNILTISVSDGVCPIMGNQNYAFEITVLEGTNAGPDINLCAGDTVQMQGENGSNFQWTPSTGLANDTVPNTMAYPAVTTTYYLTSDFPGTCDTLDSMTIFVVATFATTITTDQSICLGDSVQLNVTATPAQAYTYQWAPGAGLDSTQITSPMATPTSTTSYIVAVTSPSLCTQMETVVITVDTTSLEVTPSSTLKFVCPGGSTVLNANVIASDTVYTVTWVDSNAVVVGTTEMVTLFPTTSMNYTVTITNGVCADSKDVGIIMSMLDIGADTAELCAGGGAYAANPVYGPLGSLAPTVCGISTGCSGSGGTATNTVGNGTAVNDGTTYPAPFGNWYQNAKHQILYTATDLIAAGVTAGTITEIGFFVDLIEGTTLYKAYELKLGCTSSDSLTTWESGLSQVFAPTNVTITTGMNTLVLTNGFDWDGTTNLVLEICFDNLADPSWTNNSHSPYTTTGYSSVLYYTSDVTLACPETTTSGSSSNRPNTTFTVCSETIDPSFSWTPSTGVSDDTIANPNIAITGSTTYYLTMDNGFCVITDSVRLEYSTTLGLIGSSADATCGATDGTATVVVGDGIAPFTYLWNDPSTQTTATASGLGLGSYTVSIIDANGCTDNMIISVSESGGPLLLVSQVDLSCFGDTNGTAIGTASGGTTPYTFLWDDPATQTNDTAINLSAGTYTLTVEGGGCASSISVTLTEPTQITAVATSSDPTCFNDCDGTAGVTVSGGVNPFGYIWDDPAAQTNAGAIGLCDGAVKVVYTDANGCEDSTSITITEPVDIITSIVSISQNPCFGDCVGSATLGITSGGVTPFAYSWDDPSSQTNAMATLLCAGTYNGMVTDSNGCTSIPTAAIITEPAVLSVAMSSLDANCGVSDGSAVATVAGGTVPYVYSWDDPGTQSTDTAGGVGFGVYTVVVTDSNACTVVDSISVNNIGAPTLTAVVTSNASCFGVNDGVATASASGGTPPFLYGWDDPSNQTNAVATGLGTGSYTVIVADSNSCSASAFVTITEPTLLTATISMTDITCNGFGDGNGIATASGGTAPYFYLWDDGSATTTDSVSGLVIGFYTCTITDTNGCTVAVSDSVYEPGKIFMVLTGTNETCSASNGQATIGAVGGTLPYTYLWNDPAATTGPIALGLSAGTYTVVITDTNGCNLTDSVSILNLDVTLGSLTNTNTNCACDGSATASPTGGQTPYGYLWDDPSAQTGATANNLCPGTYTVILTDANGCTETDSISVTGLAGFTLSSTIQGTSCNGTCDGQVTTIPSGGASHVYVWDDPGAQTNANAVGLCAGDYVVLVSDSTGCTNTDTVTVTEPGVLVGNSSVQNVSCGGSCDGQATSAPSGGTSPYVYAWSDPAAQTTATAVGLCAGTYTVILSDANGCIGGDTALITEPSGLTLTSVKQNACSGTCDGQITTTPSGGSGTYVYLWNDPATQTTQTATGLCAGTFAVLVTDSTGCTATDTVTIAGGAGFTVTSTVTDVVCAADCDGASTVSPVSGVAPFAYLWNDPGAQTTATAVDLCKGTFMVTVTDSAGCTTIDTVTIGGPNALSVTITAVDATPGNSNGSAEANPLGGANPMTYLWSDAAAQTTKKATGLAAGPYTVTVTDGAGCTATQTVTISESTGIWDLKAGARFDVYPNPTTGMVVFDLELLEVGGITIQVLDVMGKLVHQTTQSSVHLLKRETDLSALSDGIYFVKLTTDKGTINRRIVVSK